MKNRLTFVVGVLVVLVLLAYMFTYQVRYNEVAVVTTFDKAGPDSVKDKPQLYFRLPWPVQKVEKYTTLLQLMDDPLEERKTRDNFAIIVRDFVTWRVTDPLQFFVTLRDDASAKRQLAPMLRDLQGIFGEYRFDQLVNNNPDQLKLREIEDRATNQMNEWVTARNWGIKIERIGIRRVLLPEQTTAKVFDRMKQTRQRMAQNARSEGAAQAETIRSEAETAQKVILAFAEGRALAIRAEGNRLAAESYKLFDQDPDFAIFLRQIEAMKKYLANNATFIVSAKDMGLDMGRGPDAGAAPGKARASGDEEPREAAAAPAGPLSQAGPAAPGVTGVTGVPATR